MLSYKSLINEGRLYRAVRSRIIKHNDKSVSRDRAVGSSWLLRSTSESEYNPESRSDRKQTKYVKSLTRDRAVGSSWLLRSTSESEYNPESRSDRKQTKYVKSLTRDRAVGSSWLLRSTSESEYNPESRSDRKVARKLISQYRGIEQLVARRAHNPEVVRFKSHSRNHSKGQSPSRP